MTIQEIKVKLVNDEIDFSDAYDHIKKFPKPWQTNEWKEKRSEIINTECQQCKTSEGEMVAQHLTHPKVFKEIRNEIFNSRFNEYLKTVILPKPLVSENKINEFHNQYTTNREACPHCRWIRIRKRKTILPVYFCDQCKVAFDNTINIKYNEVFKTIFPNEEQVINYLNNKIEQEILSNCKLEFYAKIEKQINKKALLISIDLHLKYMEFGTVVTFCKRCASKMDLENKLLCWNCKTDYFYYLQYDNCYKCFDRKEVVQNPFKLLIRKFISEDNNFT